MMHGMDEKWVEYLKRHGERAGEIDRDRLRRLSMEESIRRFEDLCRVVHAEFGIVPGKRSHPVGLIKYWKSA